VTFEDGKSRLRGKSLDNQKPPEQVPSRLRGKSVDVPAAVDKGLSAENLKGKTLVQRDSGKEFRVAAVHTPDVGSDRHPVANLEAIDGKSGLVTLGVGDLLAKLNTLGGSWRLKE
jgi:hypothetical protein